MSKIYKVIVLVVLVLQYRVTSCTSIVTQKHDFFLFDQRNMILYMIFYRNYTYLENILMLLIEISLLEENENLKDTKLKKKWITTININSTTSIITRTICMIGLTGITTFFE